MKKPSEAVLYFLAGAVLRGTAYATGHEGQNVVGRAADSAGNRLCRTQDNHYFPRSKRVRPNHSSNHAHPIRMLEGIQRVFHRMQS